MIYIIRFPETGNSSNIYFGLGCLFYCSGKIDMACKCFLKCKTLRDQYFKEDTVNLNNSAHHFGFVLNNIACCLVSYSKSLLPKYSKKLYY